jgi:hypothetical protein
MKTQDPTSKEPHVIAYAGWTDESRVPRRTMKTEEAAC